MERNNLIEELDSDTSTEDSTDASIISAGLGISEAMRQRAAKVKPHRRKDGREYGHKERKPGRLTEKQQQFASLVAQGLAPKDAYKKAYNHRTDNEASAVASAHKLMRNEKVSALIGSVFETIKENVIADAVATRRHVMEQLLRHAEDAKHESTKLKALELMGKAVGMFTDRVEQKVEEVSTERLKKELESSLALLDNVRPIRKHTA